MTEGILTPAEYPPQLLAIPRPPRELHYIGSPATIAGKVVVAIIGSRDCSQEGRDAAASLAYAVASVKGTAVVSGLAEGIDNAAGWGAILASGNTATVLPSGLHNIYPTTGRELAGRIGKVGLLLSEYPDSASCTKTSPLERNRIIVGLAHIVVVVEAKAASGTMATARLAAKQGRPLIALWTVRDTEAVRELNKLGAKFGNAKCVVDMIERLKGGQDSA